MWIKRARLREVIADEVEKQSRGYMTEITALDPTAKEEALDQPSDFDALYMVWEQVSWVRACVDVIRRAITAQGWELKPIGSNPSQEHFEKLAKFFTHPNPQDTFVELLGDIIRDFLVVGNGYWEKVPESEGSTVPGELWTLDPSHIKIRVDPHGLVTGYQSAVDGRKKVSFEPHEVVHFKDQTKGSQPYGLSRISAIADSIVLDQNARKYNKAFFKRGAKVRGMVILKNATREQSARNRKYLEMIAKKPEISRGDLLIEGDADYKDLGAKPSEIEFLKLLEFVRDEVLAVYGTPPSKIALIESGNIGAGSGESQDKTFHEETIVPLQMKIEDKITHDLIQTGFEFDDWRFAFPRRRINRKEDSDIHKTYFDMGVFTRDDIREDLGLGPMAPETEKKIDADESVWDQDARVLDMENSFEKALLGYFQSIKQRLLNGLDELPVENIALSLGECPLERRTMYKDFSSYRFEQFKFPVKLKQIENVDDLLALIKTEEIEEILNTHMRGIGDAGGQIATDRLHVPDTTRYLMTPETVSSLAVYANDLGSFIATNLSDSIKFEVLTGVQRGESINAIKNRVAAAIENNPPIPVKAVKDPITGEVTRAAHNRHLPLSTRAKLIARTETNRAINRAALDAYDQAGIKQCEIVNPGADAECQAFIDDNPYSVADCSEILPIHHNCRCTWAPIVAAPTA